MTAPYSNRLQLPTERVKCPESSPFQATDASSQQNALGEGSVLFHALAVSHVAASHVGETPSKQRKKEGVWDCCSMHTDPT